MADLQFNISENLYDAVEAYATEQGNYQEEVTDPVTGDVTANPVDKRTFTRTYVEDEIKRLVLEHHRAKRHREAQEAINTELQALKAVMSGEVAEEETSE